VLHHAPVAAAPRAYAARVVAQREAGGKGARCGGKGIVVEYRVRTDGCFLTCAYTRNKHSPWALAGGREGSPNYVEVVRRDGTVEEYAVVTALEVNEGDVIRLHTGNGGGHGDPRQRARKLVLDDVRNGYVSEAVARVVYGLSGDG